MPRIVALVCLSTSLLAASACSVKRVNRAAMVPHMTPTLRAGAPFEAPVELSVGASSVAHTTLGASDESAAVEIPGTQAEVAARLRLTPHVGLGILYARGFGGTAEAIKDNQPPIDGDVAGGGMSINGVVPTSDPRWHVGINAEFLVWNIPYVEYATCIENCGPVPWTSVEHDSSSIGQVALGIVPTFDSGSWRAWGGVTVRNHPTIEQKDVEVGVDAEDEVEAGSFNAVVSAGVDLELGAGIRAGATLYQVVIGEPASYGPSLAATLTVPLGAGTSKARAAATSGGAVGPVGPGGR